MKPLTPRMRTSFMSSCVLRFGSRAGSQSLRGQRVRPRVCISCTSDHAAVPADGEDAAFDAHAARVRPRGAAVSGGEATRALRSRAANAGDVDECTRIRRRHRADQRIHLARRLDQSIRPSSGPAGAEVAPAREIVRPIGDLSRRRSPEAPRQSTVRWRPSPCRTPRRAVSSGRIGHRLLVDDAAGIGAAISASACRRKASSAYVSPVLSRTAGRFVTAS